MIGELEDPRAEAAIGWMVAMRSGATSEQELRAFETWIRADPGNEAAWIRLQEGLMPYGVASRQRLPVSAIVRERTKDGPSRRTFATGLVSCLGVGAVGGGLLNQFIPLDGVLADHFTLTSQQERVRLADGSEIVLAPRTAVNVRYQPGLRKVELLGGEVLVQTASRAAPFQLTAGSVTLGCNAGTFAMESRDTVLSVTGIQGAGHLSMSGEGASYALAAGDRIEFEDGRIRRLKIDPDAARAWLDGLLVAKDCALSTLVGQLRPYFPGLIRIDPTVAPLRVTGVFSLKNPSDTLDALAESLNLSLTRVAHYWVALGPGRA